MTTHPNKHFISAGDLLEASFSLALKILDSGFRPDVVVGIWRGGTPVAIAVHEVFKFAGLDIRHLPVVTSSYTGIGAQSDVYVFGLDPLIPMLKRDTKLLLVDDVYDSGRSIAAIRRTLGPAWPENTRVATAYFKPAGSNGQGRPDFFAIERDDWLVFPHELQDLSAQEITASKPLGDRLAALMAGQG